MFAGVRWVVFTRSYWSICLRFVFVCVCIVFAACWLHVMVWFRFHYVASGDSVQIPRIGIICPVGDQGPSAAGVSLTPHSSGGCVTVSIKLTWLQLISTFESISIIADHRSGYSRPHARGSGRWLGDRLPTAQARNYAVCLVEILQLAKYSCLQITWLHGRVSSSSALDTKQYKLTWQFDFLLKMTDSG